MRLDDYRVMQRPDKKLESAWGLWSEKTDRWFDLLFPSEQAAREALDYVRGTPVEIALWREGDAEARANLAIEGMDLGAGDHAGNSPGGEVVGYGVVPPARPRDPPRRPHRTRATDMGDHGPRH